MVLVWVFDPKRELLYNVCVMNSPCLVCAMRDQIRNMTVTVTPHFFHEMFSHTSDSVLMLTVEKNAVKYAKNVPQHLMHNRITDHQSSNIRNNLYLISAESHSSFEHLSPGSSGEHLAYFITHLVAFRNTTSTCK